MMQIKKKLARMQNKKNPMIFVVEDNPMYNDIVMSTLKMKHFTELRSFKNAEACMKDIHLNPDIIVLNYSYSDFTGLDLMQKVHETKPWIDFIFLSGQNSIEVAVKIMRSGAFDYIVKNEKAPGNLVAAVNLAMSIRKKKSIKKGFGIGVILFFVIVLLLILVVFSLSLISDEFKLF